MDRGCHGHGVSGSQVFISGQTRGMNARLKHFQAKKSARTDNRAHEE